MLRFVVQILLIYFVVRTIGRAMRLGKRDRPPSTEEAPRQSRFDTASRDVADAEYEDVSD